jgi:hypothetical protein
MRSLGGLAVGSCRVSVFGFRRGGVGLGLDADGRIARGVAAGADLSPQSSVSLARNLLGFAQPLSVARLRAGVSRAARSRGSAGNVCSHAGQLPIPRGAGVVGRWGPRRGPLEEGWGTRLRLDVNSSASTRPVVRRPSATGHAAAPRPLGLRGRSAFSISFWPMQRREHVYTFQTFQTVRTLDTPSFEPNYDWPDQRTLIRLRCRWTSSASTNAGPATSTGPPCPSGHRQGCGWLRGVSHARL